MPTSIRTYEAHIETLREQQVMIDRLAAMRKGHIQDEIDKYEIRINKLRESNKK